MRATYEQLLGAQHDVTIIPMEKGQAPALIAELLVPPLGGKQLPQPPFVKLER